MEAGDEEERLLSDQVRCWGVQAVAHYLTIRVSLRHQTHEWLTLLCK